MRTEIDVLCEGVKIDLVFVYGSKITCFYTVSTEIGLVLVMVEVDLISVWAIDLDLISV